MMCGYHTRRCIKKILEDDAAAEALRRNIRGDRHIIKLRHSMFMDGKPRDILDANTVDIFIPKYSYIKPTLKKLLKIYNDVLCEGLNYIEADHGQSAYDGSLYNIKSSILKWLSQYKVAIRKDINEAVELAKKMNDPNFEEVIENELAEDIVYRESETVNTILKIIDTDDWIYDIADEMPPAVDVMDKIIMTVKTTYDDAVFEATVIDVAKEMLDKYRYKKTEIERKIKKFEDW